MVVVAVTDGSPFRISLAADIPAEAEEGMTLKFVAAGAIQQIEVAGDGIARVFGIDRMGVGRIDEGEAAIGVARPDGRR